MADEEIKKSTGDEDFVAPETGQSEELSIGKEKVEKYLKERKERNRKVFDASYWEEYAIRQNQDYENEIGKAGEAGEKIIETPINVTVKVTEGELFTGHHFDNAVWYAENDLDDAVITYLKETQPSLAEDVLTAQDEDSVREAVDDKDRGMSLFPRDAADTEVIANMNLRTEPRYRDTAKQEKEEQLKQAEDRGEKIIELPISVTVKVPENANYPEEAHAEAIKCGQREMKYKVVEELTKERPDLVDAYIKFHDNID